MDDVKKTAKRRKRQRRKAEENCSYTIEITGWELSYSFSLNWNEKLSDGPYWESLHLETKGILRSPEKYASKEIRAVFIGDRRIPPDPRDPQLANWKPRCVGAVTLRGEQREFIGSLPFDSLPLLSSLHEAGKIKFIDLDGKAPSYGSADIRSIHFLQKYDPEEY